MASLGGLVDGAGLLGVEGDALLTVGVDGDGLVVDETGVLLKETRSISTAVPQIVCLLASAIAATPPATPVRLQI